VNVLHQGSEGSVLVSGKRGLLRLKEMVQSSPASSTHCLNWDNSALGRGGGRREEEGGEGREEEGGEGREEEGGEGREEEGGEEREGGGEGRREDIEG